jgi:hypothetical protein
MINENQTANVFEFSESRGDPRGRPLNTIGASPALPFPHDSPVSKP